jgi:hypothetical protein
MHKSAGHEYVTKQKKTGEIKRETGEQEMERKQETETGNGFQHPPMIGYVFDQS